MQITFNTNKPETDEPSSFAKTMLGAMQGKHVYGGTVTDKVKNRRRAQDKVAKRSRKINRGR